MDEADTEAAAVWERMTKAQREHLLRLCGWGVTPGGDRSIHGFVAARVYNNLGELGLVVVYAEAAAGPRRVKWTDLGRRVAAYGKAVARLARLSGELAGMAKAMHDKAKRESEAPQLWGHAPGINPDLVDDWASAIDDIGRAVAAVLAEGGVK